MKPSHGLRPLAAGSPTGRANRALAAVLVALLLLGFAACGQPQASPTPEQTVPLEVVEGPRGAVIAFVPVSIRDQGPFPFALDTGASQSLIEQELAERLSLPEEGMTREVTGIAAVTEAMLIRVEEWRLGDVDLSATMAIRLDLPEPEQGEGVGGLLGSDVLSSFGAITVDYEREVLVVRSRR